MTLTEQMVDQMLTQMESGLPAHVLDAALDGVVDAVGCALYGAAQPEAAGLVRAVTQSYGYGNAAVCGWGIGLSGPGAALVNGAFAHLRELDDVNFAILHPGSVVVSAALGASGSETAGMTLLTAVVAGYEVMTRIGAALPYGAHREKGWHGTATCGPFGAAIAAGLCLGLTSTQLVSALGLAGTRTGGLWAFKADGAWSKRLHPGLAARDGAFAALLANQDWTGPRWILEAEDGGFMQVTGHEPDFASLTAGFGTEWAVNSTQFKVFASCRSVHPVADALLRLRSAHPELRDPQNVAAVAVGVNPIGYKMAGHTQFPATPEEALMSIAYGAATILAGGDGGPADYTREAVLRPVAQSLLSRIDVYSNRNLESYRKRLGYPSAVVSVTLKSGVSYELTNHDVIGSPTNPLSSAQVDDKFVRLTGPLIGEEQSCQLLGVLRGLPERSVGEVNRSLLEATIRR